MNLLWAKRHLAIAIFMACALFACQKPKKLKEGKPESAQNSSELETPTSGHIRLGIDESMAPVLEQLVTAFMNAYPDAKVDVWVKPEGALIRDLMADSIRMVLIGRDWADNEKKHLAKSDITPKMDQLGTDAVAMIIHKDNPVEHVTFAQLQDIVRGKITDWSQISPKGTGQLNLVFDHPESGIIRYLENHVDGSGKSLPAEASHAYAAGNHRKLFEYVSTSKGALGFVGSPWLSDEDDPEVRARFEKIKYLRIVSPDSADLPGVPVGPFPNEIALHQYPLNRGIYALSREHFTGLGTGFVVYAASEVGQRILLKAGLLPEFMPPRFVVFTGKEVDQKK